jgi:hypothetical protein
MASKVCWKCEGSGYIWTFWCNSEIACDLCAGKSKLTDTYKMSEAFHRFDDDRDEPGEEA